MGQVEYPVIYVKRLYVAISCDGIGGIFCKVCEKARV
jgi:hypothetical protein